MYSDQKHINKLLIENEILAKITARFDRSPHQLNKLLESDAEIIELNNGTFLSITLDGIVEEIYTGLYKDPYLLGWMTVVASLSDLTAVGANFIGLLLLENIPEGYPQDQFELIQKGIQDACSESGTYILGGDTNNSHELQLASVAIGTINSGQLISRVGCKEKDLLFVSNPMGLGMGFAFDQLFGNSKSIDFKPLPNMSYGQVVRKFASACIDSSDGFFPAICNLMEINSIGFKLSIELKGFIHKDVLDISTRESIPEWFFLSGPHGEFELVFTIPENQVKNFLKSANKVNWKPLLIGSVIENESFFYPKDNSVLDLDIFSIANQFIKSGGDPKRYFKDLHKMVEL